MTEFLPAAPLQVSVFHNVSLVPGSWRRRFTPNDPLVKVFAYTRPTNDWTLAHSLSRLLEFNSGASTESATLALTDAYYGRGLRGIRSGDVVTVGERVLSRRMHTCYRLCAPWHLEDTGRLNIIERTRWGTVPWPADATPFEFPPTSTA